MSQKKFIIDADTGSDDAVAILMALRDPTVEVLGITLVSGNVPLQQGILNTLYTAELCEVPVNVYAGADKPLTCLLYTSPSPRDMRRSRMPSSA